MSTLSFDVDNHTWAMSRADNSVTNNAWLLNLLTTDSVQDGLLSTDDVINDFSICEVDFTNSDRDSVVVFLSEWDGASNVRDQTCDVFGNAKALSKFNSTLPALIPSISSVPPTTETPACLANSTCSGTVVNTQILVSFNGLLKETEPETLGVPRWETILVVMVMVASDGDLPTSAARMYLKASVIG
ncbi:hypothetical protein WICPIJ_001228 [Wickerhamomyces pijperi]|uniref:Uncharacterized protein n=1 Tax=Wickerhamomyces pijperi TaxID=599730 RepID=A0A9P8QEF0_WICPI|nr:hypothetical protein WICPIJ_001228 [Wickerhamomyces pijperi]